MQHDTAHVGNRCNGQVGKYDKTHPLVQIPEELLV